MSNGGVVLETGECTCAFPDCGGYSMHEPGCGLELVGWLPGEASHNLPGTFDDEPTLLPTMLWDFGGAL